MPKRFLLVFLLFLIIFLTSQFTQRVAHSEVDCLMCHEQLSKEKVVHPALSIGCPTCHSAIDAKDIPHKKTNNIPKGLSSAQSDLCFNCHDKAMFSKKTVHPALGMGCTVCHNPHSSKNAKLLNSEPPDLCFNCHDRAEFTKKNVHPPVAGGMCTNCHNPHSTDFTSLLLKDVNSLCFNCHTEPDLKSGLHVVRGFTTGGHLVKGKTDPKRQSKEFSCVSCHTPHSSDSIKLFRYKAQSLFELCVHCHEK